MIVFTRKRIGKAKLSRMVGRTDYDQVVIRPSGILQLHPTERALDIHSQARRTPIRAIINTYEDLEIRLCFVIEATRRYRDARGKYPWLPTDEHYQLRLLSSLLDEAEQTVRNHMNSDAVLPAQKILYINDGLGLRWVDFSDFDLFDTERALPWRL